MSSRRLAFRRILAAATALALGTGGALATASSASAIDADVLTPGWLWGAVSDDAGYIAEAESLFVDYLGTDVDPYGFTDDAFDGFFNALEVSLLGDTLVYDAEEPLDGDFTFTPDGSASWVDNGLSSFVSSATVDFGDGNQLRIDRTLEIEGSYARWAFDFEVLGGAAAAADYEVTVTGDLGSDSGTTVVDAFSNTFVTFELLGFDPIIGYQVQGDGTSYGYEVADGDEVVSFNFTADGGAQVDIALLEFDPCSRDDAIDVMRGLVATLPADFGTVLDPVYADDCLYVAPPAPITGPANAFLPLLERLPLADYGYLGPASIENGLSFRVLQAPVGLSFTLENDVNTGLPGIRMTGTPGSAGDVRILFFYEDDGGVQEQPLVVTFPVSIALAATGAPASTAALGFAAAALLAGGVLLVRARGRVSATR